MDKPNDDNPSQLDRLVKETPLGQRIIAERTAYNVLTHNMGYDRYWQLLMILSDLVLNISEDPTRKLVADYKPLSRVLVLRGEVTNDTREG